MKQDLITVITSAYNAVHTISRAIDSVLNQTYKDFTTEHTIKPNPYQLDTDRKARASQTKTMLSTPTE